MADPLGPNQERFAARLASLTGLNLDVVRAWVHSEQPYDSPATGSMPYQDWLNIGWTSAGPATIAQAPDWRGTPEQGAERTAQWLSGAWGGQYGYRSAPSIRSILKSSRETPAQQIETIQASGWASSGYPQLAASYAAVRGVRDPFTDPVTGSQRTPPLKQDRPGAGGGGLFGWFEHGAEAGLQDIEAGASSLWNDVNTVTDFLKALLWLVNPVTWLRGVEALFGFVLILTGILVALGADKALAAAPGPTGSLERAAAE